jgi:hypothetical protein
MAEPVRELGFAAIDVAYVGIGTALDNPARLVYIQNLTDALLMFSMDGVNDHFPLPYNGYMIIDVTANSNTNIQGFYIARGQRFYVRELTIPTTGSVYVTSFYGRE